MTSFSRKLIAAILSVFIFISMFASFSFAANTLEIYNDSKTSKKTSVSFDDGHTYGGRFNAGAEFTKAGIEIGVSSNGKTVTVSLYKWRGSMSATVSADPVLTVADMLPRHL